MKCEPSRRFILVMRKFEFEFPVNELHAFSLSRGLLPKCLVTKTGTIELRGFQSSIRVNRLPKPLQSHKRRELRSKMVAAANVQQGHSPSDH